MYRAEVQGISFRVTQQADDLGKNELNGCQQYIPNKNIHTTHIYMQTSRCVKEHTQTGV